jgi:hypothetical protein
MMWQLCTQRVDGKRAHRRNTMSPDQDLDIGSERKAEAMSDDEIARTPVWLRVDECGCILAFAGRPLRAASFHSRY